MVKKREVISVRLSRESIDKLEALSKEKGLNKGRLLDIILKRQKVKNDKAS